MNCRVLAADILLAITRDGKSLSTTLEPALQSLPQANDRAFVQALVYGVLRWYYRLDHLLNIMTRKPIKDDRVRMLALLGFYQLTAMRVKPHAAVSETVSSVRESWARPLINGLLRTYQRDSEALNARLDLHPVSASAHPAWLLEQLEASWPQSVNEITAANNRPPPMTLRVHLGRWTRDAALERLREAGLMAQPGTMAPSAVLLEKPVPVSQIPGFAEGDFSVQDEAAQLAADLLNLQPLQRVLDLCAAPGGKSAHILESTPEVKELVALDIAPERLERVRENLHRIGLDGSLIAGDALRPETWWDGQTFDRILVDAPCSALGVIRRHPDIKLLRQPSDLEALATIQMSILRTAWSLLKPGGQIVYATCSILPLENVEVIAAFLAAHPEAIDLPIVASWGISQRFGRQILTGMNDMDGFYYARIMKPCDQGA